MYEYNIQRDFGEGLTTATLIHGVEHEVDDDGNITVYDENGVDVYWCSHKYLVDFERTPIEEDD